MAKTATAPHVERMHVEERELTEKVESLRKFLFTETYAGLDDHDKFLLVSQYTAMQSYLTLLSLRLDRA